MTNALAYFGDDGGKERFTTSTSGLHRRVRQRRLKPGRDVDQRQEGQGRQRERVGRRPARWRGRKGRPRLDDQRVVEISPETRRAAVGPAGVDGERGRRGQT